MPQPKRPGQRRRVSREPLLFNDGILSNFHHAWITLPDPVGGQSASFATNEHYFQARKAAMTGATIEHYEAIRDARTPTLAKRLASKRKLPMTARQLLMWDQRVSMLAMLECNLAKYSQHEDCLAYLKKTGNRPLVEHRPDPIWGDNLDGTGMNLLGRTLEIVRARLCA